MWSLLKFHFCNTDIVFLDSKFRNSYWFSWEKPISTFSNSRAPWSSGSRKVSSQRKNIRNVPFSSYWVAQHYGRKITNVAAIVFTQRSSAQHISPFLKKFYVLACRIAYWPSSQRAFFVLEFARSANVNGMWMAVTSVHLLYRHVFMHIYIYIYI